jgi:hypothetical protein
MNKLIFAHLIALLLALANNPLRADFFAFTDRTAFDNFNTPNYHLSFDSLQSGVLLPTGSTVEEIAFVYNFGGTQLSTTNAFSAPSGNISIGTNDGGNALQDGDTVRFDFSARFGFGLYVIGSAADFRDGDITLTVGTATASLDKTKVQPFNLADGGSVYFLGIHGDANSGFSSAVLRSNSGQAAPAFTFNFDSIVSSVTAVPEPSSLLLVLASGTLFYYRGRRR